MASDAIQGVLPDSSQGETSAGIAAPSPEFLSFIPRDFARRHLLVSQGTLNGTIERLLVSPTTDPSAIFNVGVRLQRSIHSHVDDAERIARLIDEAYASARAAADSIADHGTHASAVELKPFTLAASGEIDRLLAEADRDLLSTSGKGEIVRLVDAMLFEALGRGASDVHVQPQARATLVRYRIDGVLHTARELPTSLTQPILSRIKVMGRMDIAERRLAQDGRATVTIGVPLSERARQRSSEAGTGIQSIAHQPAPTLGTLHSVLSTPPSALTSSRSIDLRISTFPTSYGERAVIRLLESRGPMAGHGALSQASSHASTLDSLGMPEALRDAYLDRADRASGIVLVTGPTGSGKTTTLYATLRWLSQKWQGELNVMTIEDPIEYELSEAGVAISQGQVNTKKGITFATGLRHILRQDPDVIMVGEIRDAETARIAIQASLTGHLVFSTLHTSDSPGAVTRLADLGVDGVCSGVGLQISCVRGALSCVNGALTRERGALTCVGAALSCVSGELSRVSGALSCVSGAFSRVSGALSCVSGALSCVSRALSVVREHETVDIDLGVVLFSDYYEILWFLATCGGMLDWEELARESRNREPPLNLATRAGFRLYQRAVHGKLVKRGPIGRRLSEGRLGVRSERGRVVVRRFHTQSQGGRAMRYQSANRVVVAGVVAWQAVAGATAQLVDPMYMTHSWSVKGQSSTGADSANGVAVNNKGVTFAGGTYSASAASQGFARMYTPTGASAGRLFVNHTGGQTGQAFVNGVSTSRFFSDATGYYAGSFRQDVNFNSGGTPARVLTTDNNDDAFVVMLTSANIGGTPPTADFKSVTRLGGAGVQEALAVSASHGAGGGPFAGGYFAVVGRFTNQLQIPGQTIAVKGAHDGFIQVYNGAVAPTGGDPLQGQPWFIGLTIGDANPPGTAVVFIRGVQIDPWRNDSITVTGEYRGTVDFDPELSHFTLTSDAASSDIFVANYVVVDIPTAGLALVLNWIYAVENSGTDSGQDVAMDVNGDAYATGYLTPTALVATQRDIWIAKINREGWGQHVIDPVWEHTIGGAGDDVGYGIDTDGLDRIVVTGQFGGTLDFDVGGGIKNLNANGGGQDAFVVRYRDHLDRTSPATLFFDGGYRLGGSGGDVGRGVAVDPIRTTRHAVVGAFTGTNTDFDPGAGTANLSSTGNTDPFISTILPTIPSGIKSQVAVTVDTSGSTTNEEYDTLMGIYASILPDANVIPQDRKLALAFTHTAQTSPVIEDQIVPWTVVSADTTSDNAAQFAARVTAHPQSGGANGTTIDDSIQSMLDIQLGDRINACWRQLFVVSDGENRGFDSFPGGVGPAPDTVMQTARDAVLSPPVAPPEDVNVTHVHAFAALGDPDAFWNDTQLGTFGRGYMRLNVTSADYDDPNPQSLFGNMGLAMQSAVETFDVNQYLEPSVDDRLALMLKRITRCPGDFDRDGDVDGTDESQFLATPTDWDLDGDLDAEDLVLFDRDFDQGCCP